MRTKDKLAQALTEAGAAADRGKTYVDLIMKGIELLLAELCNTGQKN